MLRWLVPQGSAVNYLLAAGPVPLLFSGKYLFVLGTGALDGLCYLWSSPQWLSAWSDFAPTTPGGTQGEVW